MSELLIALFVGVLAATPVLAESPAMPTAATAAPSDCEAKAIGRNGKPLAGAARTSFLKKCQSEAVGTDCAGKAVSSTGKPLTGAARTSSIRKCEADARQ